jgi:hypothetical protein
MIYLILVLKHIYQETYYVLLSHIVSLVKNGRKLLKIPKWLILLYQYCFELELHTYIISSFDRGYIKVIQVLVYFKYHST